MNITSATGGASAWAARASGPPDGAQRAQARFAKADTDGSGSVDATELQTVLDKLSQKTGTDLGKAEDRLAAMDSDGDGSLSSTELDAGIKSLLPQPSSTMAFAQQRMGGGGGPGGPGGPGGMPPPPPQGDDASDSSSSTSSSSSTDPLDTNGDGTVSMQERMAGEMSQVLQVALKAGDSDGDGALSGGEVDTLSQKLGATLSQMFSEASTSASSTGSGSGADTGQPSQQGSSDDAVKQLTQMLLRQYAQPAMDWQAQSSLSVAA
jgi:Ca2+-binding EF-hand superfamily protein